MRFGRSYLDREQARRWRPWFAWRPVRLTTGAHDGRWVWLEPVLRMRSSVDFSAYWLYKAPEEAL